MYKKVGLNNFIIKGGFMKSIFFWAAMIIVLLAAAFYVGTQFNKPEDDTITETVEYESFPVIGIND